MRIRRARLFAALITHHFVPCTPRRRRLSTLIFFSGDWRAATGLTHPRRKVFSAFNISYHKLNDISKVSVYIISQPKLIWTPIPCFVSYVKRNNATIVSRNLLVIPRIRRKEERRKKKKKNWGRRLPNLAIFSPFPDGYLLELKRSRFEQGGIANKRKKKEQHDHALLKV